jgi:hypothetical protein
MSKQASLGNLVHTTVDPRVNNGDDVAMAFVTRVKDISGEQRLNLRVILDTGADIRLTNVELLRSQPTKKDENVDRDAADVQHVAWLP